jgi:hypothetical protein
MNAYQQIDAAASCPAGVRRDANRCSGCTFPNRPQAGFIQLAAILPNLVVTSIQGVAERFLARNAAAAAVGSVSIPKSRCPIALQALVVILATWTCKARCDEPLPAAAIVWRTPIGTVCGQPVVIGNRLLVGTNGWTQDTSTANDFGLMLGIDTHSGKENWRQIHRRLSSRTQDASGQGICNHPAHVRSTAYYSTNRGEIVATDSNSGLIAWEFSMVAALEINKRDATDCGNPLPSVLADDDRIFCATCNGRSADRCAPLPCPDGPSIIAVARQSGRLLWSSSVGSSNTILANWGTPSFVPGSKCAAIAFVAGDGVLYGINASSGAALWNLDLEVSEDRVRSRKFPSRQFVIPQPVLGTGQSLIVSRSHSRGESDSDGEMLCIEFDGASERVGSAVAIVRPPFSNRLCTFSGLWGACTNWTRKAVELFGATTSRRSLPSTRARLCADNTL